MPQGGPFYIEPSSCYRCILLFINKQTAALWQETLYRSRYECLYTTASFTIASIVIVILYICTYVAEVLSNVEYFNPMLCDIWALGIILFMVLTGHPLVEFATMASERYRMIAEAAYFRAERRGFVAGSELQDWLAAEIEVDELLGESHPR